MHYYLSCIFLKNICRAFNGELAIINDAAENALLGRIIANLKGTFSAFLNTANRHLLPL
jgi:hypothetical protein